jgi:signal transduction histidine kinase
LPLPEVRPIALPEFLAEVVERSSVPDHVQVHIEVPDLTPAANADSGQLEIVIGNLVRNACDAMPEGGRLEIRAVSEDAGTVTVIITDTGHGIAPENLQRIMEPFFSTKARGIGLGLALSRAILERNSGQLTVRSEPGKGASFTVRLPAAGSPA